MSSLLYAYCPRRNVDRKTAAIHLLLHAWSYEVAEYQRDRFDWINDAGLLTVSEVHAIERAVWGKLDSSVERPQLDSEKSNE